MVRLWVTHDGDLDGRLSLKGSPFAQVGGFPCVLACISFSYIWFSHWDAFGYIGFVGVHGFSPIMELV
jgi:hypothetical protein